MQRASETVGALQEPVLWALQGSDCFDNISGIPRLPPSVSPRPFWPPKGGRKVVVFFGQISKANHQNFRILPFAIEPP